MNNKMSFISDDNIKITNKIIDRLAEALEIELNQYQTGYIFESTGVREDYATVEININNKNHKQVVLEVVVDANTKIIMWDSIRINPIAVDNIGAISELVNKNWFRLKNRYSNEYFDENRKVVLSLNE